MKKLIATAVLTLVIGGTAFAQCGKNGGCGNCNQGAQMNQLSQANPGNPASAEPDIYRQFRINTLDLRQAMMNNRFELQRENLKATPDATKVAALKAEIAAIQSKINDVRLQSGLPEDGKRDGECFKPGGDCYMMNGSGGCNGQPCWQK